MEFYQKLSTRRSSGLVVVKHTAGYHSRASLRTVTQSRGLPSTLRLPAVAAAPQSVATALTASTSTIGRSVDMKHFVGVVDNINRRY